jgi:hypothetical protein
MLTGLHLYSEGRKVQEIKERIRKEKEVNRELGSTTTYLPLSREIRGKKERKKRKKKRKFLKINIFIEIKRKTEFNKTKINLNSLEKNRSLVRIIF